MLEDTVKSITRKFKVFEDNSGGLILAVRDEGDEHFAYIHPGYEFHPGQLSDDLEEMANGGFPDTDHWDGNLLDEDGLEISDQSFEDFVLNTKDLVVVADNWGIYPDRMGRAASIEFLE